MLGARRRSLALLSRAAYARAMDPDTASALALTLSLGVPVLAILVAVVLAVARARGAGWAWYMVGCTVVALVLAIGLAILATWAAQTGVGYLDEGAGTFGIVVMGVLGGIATFVVGLVAGVVGLISAAVRQRDRVPSSALVHG
jgi:hypothetical protein